jgi:hypothetical protein
MIKIFIAFVIFSALAMYILFKGGDIDMSGEKHGVDATHTEQAAPAATAPAATVQAPAAAPAEAPAK